MSRYHEKHVRFEHSSKICFRQKSLTKGLSWAHYQNDHERIYYKNNQQHTLSLYLEGGFETHRTDVKSSFGAPGRFCLMPKESESQWLFPIKTFTGKYCQFIKCRLFVN